MSSASLTPSYDIFPPLPKNSFHSNFPNQEQPNKLIKSMATNKGKNTLSGSSSSTPNPGSITSGPSQPLSRYESQKRRDWNTFCQYLRNQRPPTALSQCGSAQVLDFLRYLDQFGKTKVHVTGCLYFGQPDPPGPCACPLRQAWGSLDALIGRLRAAFEENGGSPESNPFASGGIRIYLREVRDSQSKARGVPYKKKKKKRTAAQMRSAGAGTSGGAGGGGGSAFCFPPS